MYFDSGNWIYCYGARNIVIPFQNTKAIKGSKRVSCNFQKIGKQWVSSTPKQPNGYLNLPNEPAPSSNVQDQAANKLNKCCCDMRIASESNQ